MSNVENIEKRLDKLPSEGITLEAVFVAQARLELMTKAKRAADKTNIKIADLLTGLAEEVVKLGHDHPLILRYVKLWESDGDPLSFDFDYIEQEAVSAIGSNWEPTAKQFLVSVLEELEDAKEQARELAECKAAG